MSNTTSPALTVKQATIVEALVEIGASTTGKLAAHLNVKPQSLTSTLTAMVKAGHLESFVGDGHKGYQVTKAAAEILEPASPTEVTPEPVESTVVLTETLETALAAARERQEKGRETEVVTSKHGDYVKSAKAGSAWITTDGLFICAKGTLEGTDKAPWALYRVGETLAFVGIYKTSSTPFLVETQAPYRD
jgi:DNA-binding MarR family transcriptional regulator